MVLPFLFVPVLLSPARSPGRDMEPAGSLDDAKRVLWSQAALIQVLALPSTYYVCCVAPRQVP